MYNAAFDSSTRLSAKVEDLKNQINKDTSLIDIALFHYKYNTFDSIARQKLYFDADSILRGRCEQSQFFISRDDILNDLQQNSDFLTFFSIYSKNYCTFAL